MSPVLTCKHKNELENSL